MKRMALVLATLGWLASAQAQLQLNPRGNQPAAPAAKPKPPLQGMQRTQYILKQLELKPDQQRHAEGLIETYYAPGAEKPPIDIDEIRQIADLMKKAQDTGNTAEYKRLEGLLKQKGSASSADEPEFIDNLKRVLSDEQKTELADTLERLNANPSGALRAIDVVHTARKLKLNDKQNTDLDAAIAAFRTKVNDTSAPGDASSAEGKQIKQLEEFIAAVRTILTPEQATKYDIRIGVIRTEPVFERPATP